MLLFIINHVINQTKYVSATIKRAPLTRKHLFYQINLNKLAVCARAAIKRTFNSLHVLIILDSIPYMMVPAVVKIPVEYF